MNLEKNPKIWISIDLEMNNNSDEKITDIIQIGAVAFNIESGEILERFNKYIKLPTDKENNQQKIHPKILKLTGITDDLLNTQGVSLYLGYLELVDFIKRNNCFTDAVCWGGNDTAYLLKELKSKCNFKEKFIFGSNYFDAKKFFQVFANVNGISIRSGLAKSMTRFGLNFKGRIHNALFDAENTVTIFLFIQSKMKMISRMDLSPIQNETRKECLSQTKEELSLENKDSDRVYEIGFDDGWNSAILKAQKK